MHSGSEQEYLIVATRAMNSQNSNRARICKRLRSLGIESASRVSCCVARSLQAFTSGFTPDSVGIWWIGIEGPQAQLNLRSSQLKSLPQYFYCSKKMVLITHGHFRGNFPQPNVFLYCRFWVIRPWPRPSGNPGILRFVRQTGLS